MRPIAISYLVFALVCLMQRSSFGQEYKKDNGDAVKVLSPANFNQFLLNNHPVAQRANIIAESGKFAIKKARGNFDPKLFSDWDSKSFDGKNYYQVNESGVKIPTWLGLDLKLYHQNNTGVFLNPENKDPSNGLYGIGVSVPIGEGLFTDERRNALNKAKVMRDMNRNQQERLVMNLLNSGFKDYWEWAGQFQKLSIIQSARETAKERFDNVKTSFRGGEKQAVDTTDALSQLRRWQIRRSEIKGKYAKKRQMLGTYLWDEEQSAIELKDNVKPPDLLSLNVNTIEKLNQEVQDLDSIPDKHPQLRKYRNKLEVLSIENQWKKEQIKPELDLRYNALQGGPTPQIPEGNDLAADMKWGFSFEFPIFLRKEINSLRLNKMKRESTQLAFKNKRQKLKAKLRGLQRVLDNLTNQVKQNKQNLANYERLVEAERIRFNTGEGDLFRINYREMTYLKAQMDQVTYLVDFFKTYSEIMYQYQLYKGDIDAFNQEE